MLCLQKQELARLERALGDGLTGVASELRLVDVADFVAFIRTGQTANLKNIVQSSTELHFKPGTLRLAEPAEAELHWHGSPLITLPMKFHYGSIHAHFRLRLSAHSAAIDLEGLTADTEISEFSDLSRNLTIALNQARIHAKAKSLRHPD
jgi:hypothetical protein